ncbi:hypothetical protein P43SY_008220 [Pythium insidiosum]|uniref:Polyprotein n=1 Tax=Pythium insidiosum TaxID=114742 RepID=A0AAD5L9T1_PYTIN|nr:hypothetical protein P43SY_008220 [Pythium insidiosum]
MGELMLKQTHYITKMINRFGQGDANAVRNPMVVGQDLTPNASHGLFNSKTKYRELIGAMLYVANATRPDISIALSELSQYLECPREMHWRAAIRVLRYLKGTSSFGLKFSTSASDSVPMNGAPVIYKSKRQSSIALSSAEAEYMALAALIVSKFMQ